MGTRADFYVGKGPEAEWLGSIAWNGNPGGIDAQVLNCQSPEAFRHAVTDFLAGRDDATVPADGWPWPWDDSGTTDYSYWHFDSATWASCFGGPAQRCDLPELDDEAEDYEEKLAAGEQFVFPNMAHLKAVTLGPRSGVIVFASR